MNIEIITAPLIGGLIGLITNSIAIRMLFRPYKKITIAGIHLPFTPGLIPKEQSRIAHAIAQVIANHILDYDTILNALASDTIHEIYEKEYEKKFTEWKLLDISCKELMINYNLEQAVNDIEIKICDSISMYLITQCQEGQFVRKIIEEAFQNMKEKMNPIMYKMGKGALNTVKESLIVQAEQLIYKDGKDFIKKYMDSVYEEWMDKPVNEIVILIEKNYPDLKNTIWIKYVHFIKNNFVYFLSVLNLERIVENKINEFEVKELEDIIMEISKKELNALVWLGGLLGVLMGFINLIF